MLRNCVTRDTTQVSSFRLILLSIALVRIFETCKSMSILLEIDNSFQFTLRKKDSVCINYRDLGYRSLPLEILQFLGRSGVATNILMLLAQIC